MSDTSSQKATILAVDDDELIILTLRGLFALETEYDLLTFSDPLEALKEVSRRPIDVVISDFLMPEMNGVEFLKRVRETQPEAVRILLTGFADKENAIRAINEVGLYQYLEKPWDNQDLLLHVRNALQQGSLRKQLSEKVSALDRLLREHTELTDRHRSLERELDMAARVQKSLLPSSMPEVEGLRFASFYRSCAALGGDYYDFIQTKGSTVVLVSDVSGHGLQAALTSMLLKSIFHDAAAQASGPQDLLSQMNVRLHKYLPPGMYACASVLWIDTGSGKLRLTNAGLPYPFVLRPSTSRLDELPLAGLPLGLFVESLPDGYDSRDTELDRGDVLLVASDGLGEIRGENDQFFQDGPLRQTLMELYGKDGREVIDALVERANDFGTQEGYPDDVSLLAITKT